MSRSRDIAAFLGKTEIANTSNNALLNTASPTGLDSAQVSSIAASSGLTVYSTLNDLPSSGLTSGDQAFVSSTSRFYISNGSGWYNVALINATPNLTIDPTGAITLATDGSTPTVITLTGTDSDNADANLVYSVESDGSFANIATISQDSSVFTITPLAEGSATPGSSTLTFKVSDGISFGSGTTQFTLSFITSVENSKYTTLLAKADTAAWNNNQFDASTNAFTITEAGTGALEPTALTPYHPGGYSTYFDGSGEYIQFPASNDWGFGTSAWTIEFWYNSTDTASHDVISAFNPSSPFTGWGVNVGLTGNGLVSMFFSDGIGSDGFDTVSGTTTINDGDWHHVVVTAPASSTTVTCYVDGVSAGSHTFTVAASTTGQILNVGCDTNPSPSRPMEGYVRDVRIVKGTAVYTSAFTPPTEPLTAIANTSLLTCHLPYITDGSSNNRAVTISGDPRTRRFAPYDYDAYAKADHGGSVYFDGVSGNKLTIPISASLQKASGQDFTFEAWIYPTAAVSYDMIVTAGDQGVDFGYTFFWHNTSRHLMIEAGSSGWSSNAYTSTVSDGIVQLNQWQHVAFMYSGGNLTVFRNGKVAIYQVGAFLPQVATSGLFALGGYMDGGTQHPFKGYMADVRIVQSAVYTSNTPFTPPSAPLTAIANTQLLTCTNTNNIWDVAAGTLLGKNGTTATDTQRQFATSSAMYFDGFGDYIDVQTPNLQSDYTFGKNGEPFTIEFWIKPNSNSNTQFWFHASGGAASWSTSNGHHFFWYLDGGNVNVQFNIGNNLTTMSFSASLINTAAWQHMAWAYDGTTHRLFLNGTQRASSTSPIAAVTAGTYTVRWGRHTDLGIATYFDGYMQDMRVTKGLARYTANFTPPTAEFEG